MNLASLLRRSAAADPERPALALGTAAWCAYGELARRSATPAGHLRERFGPGPGERVALAMANGPAFIEMLYACWHAGLAAVPINAKLHPAEFRYILEHSGARLCFASHKLAEAIAPVTADLASLEALIDIGSAAMPSTWPRAARTTWPGCSTPAAPPGGPRAPCSRTATSWP